MTVGLLLHHNKAVAEYLFKNHVTPRMKYNGAIGIMIYGQLSGGILLQCYNGFNVEVSYYGHGTLTPGLSSAWQEFGLNFQCKPCYGHSEPEEIEGSCGPCAGWASLSRACSAASTVIKIRCVTLACGS